jgi:hypothetical protein
LRFFEGEFEDVFETDVATVAVMIRTPEAVDGPAAVDRAGAAATPGGRVGSLFYFTLLDDDLSGKDLFLLPGRLAFGDQQESSAFSSERTPAG